MGRLIMSTSLEADPFRFVLLVTWNDLSTVWHCRGSSLVRLVRQVPHSARAMEIPFGTLLRQSFLLTKSTGGARAHSSGRKPTPVNAGEYSKGNVTFLEAREAGGSTSPRVERSGTRGLKDI
jgi:hypothetical protein